MSILKYKSFFITLSLLLVIGSLTLIGVFGIKKGVDFTGGTVAEISYPGTVPTLVTADFEKEGIKLFQTGTSTYRLISTDTTDKVGTTMGGLLSQGGKYPFVVNQIETVGPTLGAEMTKKALIAIAVVVLAILLFIAFSFRGVSYPVSSWKYGVIAMVTLLHDILVATGVYTLLSHYHGAEVDALFIVALLTILGVSISDKIVVFDRIRENLKLSKNTSFEDVVGKSLSQTFTRSINTSVTVVLALVVLYLYGPHTTQFFALTLIVGMVVGTYSSIFVASPLLTVWNRTKSKA